MNFNRQITINENNKENLYNTNVIAKNKKRSNKISIINPNKKVVKNNKNINNEENNLWGKLLKNKEEKLLKQNELKIQKLSVVKNNEKLKDLNIKVLKDNFEIYLNDFYEEIKIQKKFNLTSNLQDYKKYGVSLGMRKVLFDWILSLCINFKQSDRTYNYCIEIIDYYSINQEIKREEYQLIGITCLFISSKYNEIYPINLKNLSVNYSKESIFNIEHNILNVINFNYFRVIRLDYLDYFIYNLNLNKKQINFIQFINEILYEDIFFYYYDYELISISIIYLTSKIFKITNIFTVNNDNMIEFNLKNMCILREKKKIINCFLEIYDYYSIWKKNDSESNLFKKFKSDLRYNVSLLNISKK